MVFRFWFHRTCLTLGLQVGILPCVNKVREIIKRINIKGSVYFNEPMANHTTFQVGGPAEVFIRPETTEDVVTIHELCRSEGIPLFVLGGGANILVSDKGVSGVVLDMTSLDWIEQQGSNLLVGAGTPVSKASAHAADRGLGGFDFIYAMPGSFGGAVWMNARCYGSEMIDILTEVTYLDSYGTIQKMKPDPTEFAYKDTPFMKKDWIILSGTLGLRPDQPDQLWKSMKDFEEDRRTKGHFFAPCAGSVFKNNREFGSPSGQIIDSLGLRGTKRGMAQISPNHANIIINTGNARAQDIYLLMQEVQTKVREHRGFELEPEILLVGDWD